ncbi:hypothetical protein EDB89DRAFT_1813195, partial [Lactarius sanguifluus]
QVMFKEHDFQSANVAIQTTLTIYTHSQTTGTMVDTDNEAEYIIPVYNDLATPHGIARQDDDISHLDWLQLVLVSR